MSSRQHLKPLALGAVITLAISSGPAQAQTNAQDMPDVMGKVFACQTQTDDAKRLACFDAAIGNLQEAEDQGEIITVSREQVEKVEKDSFGFNIPSLPSLSNLFGGNKASRRDTDKAVAVARAGQPEPADEAGLTKRDIKRPFEGNDLKEVQLKIVKIQEFGYKKQRFYLENGQIWTQIDGKILRAPKIRKNKDTIAHISRAALGSYLLRINDKGQAIRVRRTQ